MQLRCRSLWTKSVRRYRKLHARYCEGQVAATEPRPTLRSKGPGAWLENVSNAAGQVERRCNPKTWVVAPFVFEQKSHVSKLPGSRARDQPAAEFRRLADLLAEVVGRLDSASAVVESDEVWALMDALDKEGQRLFAAVLTPEQTSARARLLAYLIQRPRVWVPASTLRRVAGITAWQRRLRELRVDDGWRIDSGGTSYRLLAQVADAGAAASRRARRAMNRQRQ